MVKKLEIELGNYTYLVEKNYKDGFDADLVIDKYTDYFEPFDYIFGDFSYDKLRLKGFYKHSNPNATEINDIDGLNNYIKNHCAYECRYFLLEKIQKSQEK